MCVPTLIWLYTGVLSFRSKVEPNLSFHSPRTDDLYDLYDLYDIFPLHDLDIPGKIHLDL